MTNSQDLAQHFLIEIQSLKSAKGGKIGVEDVASILDGMTKAMKDYFSEEDKLAYYEIRSIAAKIKDTKEASVAAGEKISGKSVNEANLELDAVVKATEKATNQILDCVEKMQTAAQQADPDIKKAIDENATKIFESCNFQDITGQRIKKVVNTLLEIEKSVNAILEGKLSTKPPEAKPVTQKDKDKALMNGPQLEGKAPSQDDIDKLFDSIQVKKDAK